MSVNDESDHPWLVAEKALIAEAVRGGTPFWGSCLGVQLLASSPRGEGRARAAARGRHPPRPRDTRGARRSRLRGSRLAAADAAVAPGHVRSPGGRGLLATSPAYPNQAFRVGDVAYGVQFHVEVDEAMADEWARVPAYISSADEVLGAGGLDRLLADFRARWPRCRRTDGRYSVAGSISGPSVAARSVRPSHARAIRPSSAWSDRVTTIAIQRVRRDSSPST